MRRINPVIGMMLAATMFACKEAPPPSREAPVESASQARRIDERAIAERLAVQKAAVDEAYERGRAREERQRNVEALRAVARRWADGVTEARRTARFDIAAQIVKLQAIRNDASAIEVDDCTGNARTALQSAMTTWLDAFGAFQKETGESTDATTQKVQQAEEQLRAAQQGIDACLNK